MVTPPRAAGRVAYPAEGGPGEIISPGGVRGGALCHISIISFSLALQAKSTLAT